MIGKHFPEAFLRLLSSQHDLKTWVVTSPAGPGVRLIRIVNKKCPELLFSFVAMVKGNQKTLQTKIMSTQNGNQLVQVYLMFNGRCEEAVEFYRKAVGAQVDMMMRHKESPQPAPPGMVPPGFENKIMHCSFRIGQTTVMASDGCSAGNAKFEGFSLSITVPNEAEADRAFAALSEGGKVTMPLTKTFWSPRFGMLEDKFGISWMVNVAP